jgi:hypothetical protein
MAQGLDDASGRNILGALEHNVECHVALVVAGLRIGVAVDTFISLLVFWNVISSSLSSSGLSSICPSAGGKACLLGAVAAASCGTVA